MSYLELALSMTETTGEIDGTTESMVLFVYVGDNYVHHLTQYKTDGKLVELNAHCVHVDHGCGSCDCSDVIVNKYSDLLTTQFENEKLYFESLLR